MLTSCITGAFAKGAAAATFSTIKCGIQRQNPKETTEMPVPENDLRKCLVQWAILWCRAWVINVLARNRHHTASDRIRRIHPKTHRTSGRASPEQSFDAVEGCRSDDRYRLRSARSRKRMQKPWRWRFAADDGGRQSSWQTSSEGSQRSCSTRNQCLACYWRCRSGRRISGRGYGVPQG